MNDRAPGEVKRRNVQAGSVEQAAHAPHHVGHGTVDEDGPEGEKESHGAELHALGESSGDEGGGDDGEHELVDHVGLLGNGGSVVGVGSECDTAEKEVLKAADKEVSVAEGERITDDCPDDSDQAHHGKTLHHGAEDVLSADKAAVEEGETGAGHEQDEGGGDEHPGVVTGGLSALDGLLQGGNLRLGDGALGGSGCGGGRLGEGPPHALGVEAVGPLGQGADHLERETKGLREVVERVVAVRV